MQHNLLFADKTYKKERNSKKKKTIIADNTSNQSEKKIASRSFRVFDTFTLSN